MPANPADTIARPDSACGTAAITGAASGIGAEFARQLVRAGRPLILIDKSAEKLDRIAAELSASGATVELIVADLTSDSDLTRVAERLAAVDPLAILVNSAGFGTVGTFDQTDPIRQIAMMRLHMEAPVRLCRAVLPSMLKRRSGAIINLGSISGLMRFPDALLYNATKAFLIAFSRLLALQITGSGVRVQALCPGLTRTGFVDTPDMAGFDRDRLPAFMWMTSDAVVASSLAALDRSGRVVHIPGLVNKLYVMVFGSNLGIAALNIYRSFRRHRP
jgi:short-subunit dehydrogenase